MTCPEESRRWQAIGDLEGRMKDIKSYFPHVQVPQELMGSLDAIHVQNTPYWQFAFLAWGEVHSKK